MKSPAQQKVIDALEGGASLEADYGGVYVNLHDGFRKARCLHPATERVVREHFGDRLIYVYAGSPRHDVRSQFYCLKEHLGKAADGRRIISIKPQK